MFEIYSFSILHEFSIENLIVLQMIFDIRSQLMTHLIYIYCLIENRQLRTHLIVLKKSLYFNDDNVNLCSSCHNEKKRYKA